MLNWKSLRSSRGLLLKLLVGQEIFRNQSSFMPPQNTSQPQPPADEPTEFTAEFTAESGAHLDESDPDESDRSEGHPA